MVIAFVDHRYDLVNDFSARGSGKDAAKYHYCCDRDE
jgi:hypothetical protein